MLVRIGSVYKQVAPMERNQALSNSSLTLITTTLNIFPQRQIYKRHNLQERSSVANSPSELDSGFKD
jgi:hypothetical protein